MAFDEWGNFYPDELFSMSPDAWDYGWSYDPYYGGMPSFYNDPYGIDWGSMDFSDPALWEQYGLTEADFIDDSGGGDEDGYSATESMMDPWGYLGTGEDPLGTDPGAGTDPNAIPYYLQAPAGSTGSGGYMDSILSMLAKIPGGLASLGSSLGGSVLGAAQQNPLSALMALGGIGAGAYALSRPDPSQIQPPDFNQAMALSPEQRQLMEFIRAQSAREDLLGAAALPVQGGILQNAGAMLPGLAGQSVEEQNLRNIAIQRMMSGLNALENPNQLPAQYTQFMDNAQAAERLIADTLAGGAGPTLEAQRMADERRAAFEAQQQAALGPGYVTSTPYTEAKSTEEAMIRESLEKSGLNAQAARLGMLSNISMPRAQFAEQATTGQTNRNIAANQVAQSNYQGANETANTLGKLAATTGAAAPSGSADRGLASLSGVSDRQQQLLNSIYQFNAQLQNQKNQNLWQFAGTTLGGGLYGLSRPRTT